MRQDSIGMGSVKFGGRAAGSAYFLLHFLEMCAAMCLGMVVLGPLYSLIGGMMGYSDPLHQLPELSALVLAFNMAAPMAAWMRFRGMEWGNIAEMSGAMLLEAALLIGAFWLGLISQGSLSSLQHALMMPVMLVPMLHRRHVYMGHNGHRTHLG